MAAFEKQFTVTVGTLFERSDWFGGHDFSHLPLDRPLKPEELPDPGAVEAARSRAEIVLNLVRRDKATLRQVLAYFAAARGHFTTAGTPEQIADLVEDWFTD